MNTTVPCDPSPTRCNPISRFFGWLFSWRGLRRIVIILAWTATLIALWYGEENWRSRRAWEQYRAAAEARGEHLDFKYFIPKPIPDDQNFAMYGSLSQTLFNSDLQKAFVWKDNFSKLQGHVTIPGGAAGYFHFTDLAAWEKALTDARVSKSDTHIPYFDCIADPDPASRKAAAPGVLRALQESGSILEELRAASSRPEARYPIKYNAENPASIALPHYTQLMNASRRLRLRACAELALGRNDEAMDDLKLMFYLSDSVRNEPIIIAGLVRNSLLALQSQVIWEGLAAHCWTDAQLREIQQSLLSENFLEDFKREITVEPAVMVANLEHYCAQNGLEALVDASYEFDSGPSQKPGKFSRFLAWLMPGQWYHLEQVDYCTRYHALFDSVCDPAARRVFPRRLDANILAGTPQPAGNLQALLQHRFASWKGLGVLDRTITKFAAAQCMADQASIACALERYRLAKGQYPAKLDALAPAFIPVLPHDVLTGEFYRYRLDAKDVYALYSVGWDLKDDGGKPGAKPYGLDGDWVWQ